MLLIPTSGDMERHMTSIERFGVLSKKHDREFENDIETYLEDESQKDFDDSKIYKEIKEEKDCYKYDEKPRIKKEVIKIKKIRKIVMKIGKKIKDELFEF